MNFKFFSKKQSFTLFVASLCVVAGSAATAFAAPGSASTPPPAAPAETPANPVTIIDTQETIAGKLVPGQRRTHAKGVCAQGFFTGTREAAKLSRSPLFSGQQVPVTARFSLGGGKTEMPDTTKNVRGMALRFDLPGGGYHMMAMLHTPVLHISTPEAFFEHLQTLVPDPATGKPNPEKLKAFLDKYPEAGAQFKFLKDHNPPVSYATTPYYSLHAFRLLNQANQGQYVRWRFEPQDGTHFMTDEALAKAPASFYGQALQERLAQGPVAWKMIVSLAEEGDSVNNPTQVWPKERQEVVAGTLVLTQAGKDVKVDCNPINFDPMVMSDGVEASDDPVLRFRSAAYAVSFGRRLSETQ